MVVLRALRAAEEGNLSALKSLNSSVLNEETTDETGSNCLHYAARQGGVDVLIFLVSHKGFKGNTRSDVGATPAHDAAAAGNLETLKWLIENTDCSVNDQDGVGSTVLHLACRYQHTHVTEWLLEHRGCDVNKTTASGGLPLHFAVVGRDYAAVKLLLEEDPMTVNLQISNGATAVYLASQEGAPDILRTLVQDHRGNIKIKSYDGMSCLHAATQSGHLDCVQILVEDEKYNPNERDFDGATPLHYAASQGHAHIIDWLMKVGGARITLDNLGGSPLHNAAEMNCMQCVRTLINNDCDINITDNNGLTASELARKCFHDDCAKLIQTYKAQSQVPLEPDVEYLLSAQSPRINLLRPYVTQFDGRQPPNSPSFLTQGPNTTFDTEVSLPGSLVYKEQGINQTERDTSFQQKRYSVDSLLAQADPDEFPVGVPRSFSQDFSVDSQLQPPGPNNFVNSPINSSLSSLSQLDDVIDKATKEIHQREEELATKSHDLPGKINQPRFLSDKPGTSYQNRQTVSQPQRFDITPNGNSALPRGFSYLKSPNPNEPKSVSFKISGNSSVGSSLVNDRATRLNMATNGVQTVNDGDNAVKGITNDLKTMDVDGDVTVEEEGSVQPAPVLGVYDTNMHASTQPGDNQAAHKSILKLEIGAFTDSNPKPLVNGNQTPSPQPHNGDTSIPKTNGSQPFYKQNLPFNSNHSFLKNENQNMQISREDDTRHRHQDINGTTVFPEAPPSVPAPPLPPPPPPPPPPAVNTQPMLNGVQAKNGSLSPSAIEEAKNKSVSLPARPTSMFTAEMMQSKRSTLTPASAKTVINTSQNANTDFISELKLATKGPALRKTSKSGEPNGKPMMIFSSSPKENATNGSTKEDKDSKTELVGEWDPKNFVDQVPNKDTLPNWKVVLQARQIAEKMMKETQEKRKVEERESRFKNMPPWKRALVEKKEAEARAAEEKRLEDEQKAKMPTKKALNISITPKVKDSQTTLAPWQLELQSKD